MATLTHRQIWEGIDALAVRYGLTASGLARRAGLDPTAFNKSKRAGAKGKPRWPSTESIAKILQATGASFEEFVALVEHGPRIPSHTIPLIGLAQAGSNGYFDDSGFPAGTGWEEIAFPELLDEHAYALEITGDSMLPVYRDGERIIVSPLANVRRGDRVVVKTTAGEVTAKLLGRMTARHVELHALNTAFPDRTLAVEEIAFIHRIVWASQ